MPVPVGRPPGLNGVGAAVGEAAYPVGEILAVGACRDLVGGAGPVVAGGDDAFGDPLIQVGGVGVAAAGHRDVQQGTVGGFAEHGVGGVGGDALAECTVTA